MPETVPDPNTVSINSTSNNRSDAVINNLDDEDVDWFPLIPLPIIEAM